MKVGNILSIEQLELINLIENINQKYRQTFDIFDKSKALSDNNLKVLKSILPGLIILYKWNQEKKDSSINLEQLIESQLYKYRHKQLGESSFQMNDDLNLKKSKVKSLKRLEYLAKIIKFISQEKTIQEKICDLKVSETYCKEMLEKLNKLKKIYSKENVSNSHSLVDIEQTNNKLTSGTVDDSNSLHNGGCITTSNGSLHAFKIATKGEHQNEFEYKNYRIFDSDNSLSMETSQCSNLEKPLFEENIKRSLSCPHASIDSCEMCGCALFNRSICLNCDDYDIFKRKDKEIIKHDGFRTIVCTNNEQTLSQSTSVTRSQDTLSIDEREVIEKESQMDTEQNRLVQDPKRDIGKLQERQKLVNSCSYILFIQDSDTLKNKVKESFNSNCIGCQGSRFRLRGGKTDFDKCVRPQCACESCSKIVPQPSVRPLTCNCYGPCTCNPCGDTREIINIISVGKCKCPINNCLCDSCYDPLRKKPPIRCLSACYTRECTCNPCGDPTKNNEPKFVDPRRDPSLHKVFSRCNCLGECTCSPCVDPTKNKERKCSCPGVCTCNPCKNPSLIKVFKRCNCPGICTCSPCGDSTRNNERKCSCTDMCTCNPCRDPVLNKLLNRCNCSGVCMCSPCGDSTKNKAHKCSCDGVCTCNPCRDPTANTPLKICTCGEKCPCSPCVDATRNKCSCIGKCTCNPCKDPSANTPLKICTCGEKCSCSPCVDATRNKCSCTGECICNPCRDPSANKPLKICTCGEKCPCAPCVDAARNKCCCTGECKCNPCGDPSRNESSNKCYCPTECVCNPCSYSARNTQLKCSCVGECLCNLCKDPTRRKPSCTCSGECKCNKCIDSIKNKSVQTVQALCSCIGDCECKACIDRSKNRVCKITQSTITAKSHYVSVLSLCNKPSHQSQCDSTCNLCGPKSMCLCNVCIPSKRSTQIESPDCAQTVPPENKSNPHECICEKCNCGKCEAIQMKNAKVSQQERSFGCSEIESRNAAFVEPQDSSSIELCICDVDSHIAANIKKNRPIGCTCENCTCDPCDPPIRKNITECFCKKCTCVHCVHKLDFNCVCSCYPCKCCGHCQFAMGNKQCQCPNELGSMKGCTCSKCHCDPCEPKPKNMKKCKCLNECNCNACADTNKRPQTPDCNCNKCTCDPCKPKLKNTRKCTCDVCGCQSCPSHRMENTQPKNTEEKCIQCVFESCECITCKCPKTFDNNKQNFCCICDDSMQEGCIFKCICGISCKCSKSECLCTPCVTCQCFPSCTCTTCPNKSIHIELSSEKCIPCIAIPPSDDFDCVKCNCPLCSSDKKSEVCTEEITRPNCVCNRSDNCVCSECRCGNCNPDLIEKCDCRTRSCEKKEDEKNSLPEQIQSNTDCDSGTDQPTKKFCVCCTCNSETK